LVSTVPSSSFPLPDAVFLDEISFTTMNPQEEKEVRTAAAQHAARIRFKIMVCSS
jgi:hypothetical protein